MNLYWNSVQETYDKDGPVKVLEASSVKAARGQGGPRHGNYGNSTDS